MRSLMPVRPSAKEVSAMTTRAYILIETAVGKNREAVNALKLLTGVSEVDVVTGPFDLIVMVESDSLADVGDLVTTRIHPIPGINRTVTCLVV
jgi:DNA-binding Lrp family transcriptional regulator